MGFHWLARILPVPWVTGSLRTPWPSPWASIAHAWPPRRAANAAPRPGPRPMPRWRGRRRIRRVRWKPRVACAGSWRSRRWKPIKCFFFMFLYHPKGFFIIQKGLHHLFDSWNARWWFPFFQWFIPNFGEDGSIWTSIFCSNWVETAN